MLNVAHPVHILPEVLYNIEIGVDWSIDPSIHWPIDRRPSGRVGNDAHLLNNAEVVSSILWTPRFVFWIP